MVDIREGWIDQGFNQLKNLLAKYPDNQKLKVEYIVLSHANAQFSVTV